VGVAEVAHIENHLFHVVTVGPHLELADLKDKTRRERVGNEVIAKTSRKMKQYQMV
jgi:hypothetical protein